jgi:L-fuculose-phosphate aldolase
MAMRMDALLRPLWVAVFADYFLDKERSLSAVRCLRSLEGCHLTLVRRPPSVPVRHSNWLTDYQNLQAAGAVDALDPVELPFRQLIYAHTDAAAVVHTHSTAATVVSTVVEELPTIHYILAVMGGPIRVAPYATFGSQELAENVVAAIGSRSGVLLANHGAITYGPTMEVAYDRALYLEWVAEVWLRAHFLAPGFTPRLLGEAEMAEVYTKIVGTYGTTGRPKRTPTPP